MTDPADTLARTIWGEARGEPDPGMEAVACVILNRAAHPRWWGHDVVGVCLAPFQFSCWNLGDPNRDKMLAVTSADPQFARALQIAAEAVAGRLADITKGADSYVDLRVARPTWALQTKPVAYVGHHTFFRLEIPPPALEPSPMNPLAILSLAATLAPSILSTVRAVEAFASPAPDGTPPTPASPQVADVLLAELGAAARVGPILAPVLPIIRKSLTGAPVNDADLAALRAAADRMDALVDADEKAVSADNSAA